MHYAAIDKPAWENTDPMRIYHVISSITDKIDKHVWNTPRAFKYAFKYALIPEAALQLAESVHLGRYPQVMQVSTS